ncbi:MAG TPA: hypothetical protein VKV27_00515 [Solirubrobacteraceae bacterium]|nr:hypothetical protein [Solirubrobacteraceae bacterium]
MTSLGSVSELYDIAETWEGDRFLVEHPVVEQFSAAVGALLAALGEDQHEDFWAGITRPLKRLRWLLATTPLPVNHPAHDVRGVAGVVAPRLRQCRHTAPALAEQAEGLADILEHLWACGDDPLGDAVREAADGSLTGVVLLLADGRLADSVAAAFGESRVLTAPQLLRTRTPRAIAIGPSSWFPPAIVRAPRAEYLTFAYFGWLRDRDPEPGLLVGSPTTVRSAIAKPPARSTSRARLPLAPEVDASEWVPRIEWGAVTRAARRTVGAGHGEPVPAQLFILVSGDGVYLDVKDGAQAYIAELEDEINVRQVPVSSLSEGTFLIVRTEGEGDYIRELADSLLGNRAADLRAVQARWKEKLATELEERGARAVCRRLTRLGAPRAREDNVRRWASPDSIRPNDPRDFAAICEMIGEPADELWQAMSTIFVAHLQAGNEVRKLLVEEIRKADSAALLQRGWYDYDVESIEGEGALRVARIVGRAPDLADVPRSRLRKPFRVSEDLWLG